MKTHDVRPDQSGLRYLKGIGPKRAQLLEKMGVRSIQDLLYCFPRRYEDRSTFRKIAQLIPGEPATIKGRILSAVIKGFRKNIIVEIVVGDETGMVPAVWFNQPYLKNQFTPDREVIFFGKADFHQGRFQLNSPEYELLESRDASIHTGRITPIYPLTEGLYQKSFRSILYEVIHHRPEAAVEELLPDNFRVSRQLMERSEAFRNIHFPESLDAFEQARRRLVFEEFFLFEISLLEKIQKMKTSFQAHAIPNLDEVSRKFMKLLPFTLTDGQEKALQEIQQDLSREVPMNRLLMGDVGSGKTVLALYSLAAAALAGFQGAFLVPTEVLAQQHFDSLSGIFAALGQSLKLLTAHTDKKKRERLLAELKQGKVSCLVGTHALLQEDVAFKDLAVVVIDEQHKFGVHQRCQLLNRTPRPHQLVMTATPIPRTLALTAYGDLDISVMRGLPKGRKPVKTYWIARTKQPQVFQHILDKVSQGEQAYLLFPLVEETEKADLLAASSEFARLSQGFFKNIRMGLVHGRLPAAERDAVMRAFKDKQIQILVATSVVEVGVDNPNATMVVIENAERFGLSQLHQIRGRVGRGGRESECFLFGEPSTEEGKKRLRLMTKVQDGFEIAEQDLLLRGPGDFWGTRQSGEPLFRLADPSRDQALLLEARQDALELVRGGELKGTGRWELLKNYLDQFPIRY